MGRSVQRGGSPGQLDGSGRRSLCPAVDSKHTCTAADEPDKWPLVSDRCSASRIGMEKSMRLHSGSQRRCAGQHKRGPVSGWTLGVQVRARADPRHGRRQLSRPHQRYAQRAPGGQGPSRRFSTSARTPRSLPVRPPRRRQLLYLLLPPLCESAGCGGRFSRRRVSHCSGGRQYSFSEPLRLASTGTPAFLSFLTNRRACRFDPIGSRSVISACVRASPFLKSERS